MVAFSFYHLFSFSFFQPCGHSVCKSCWLPDVETSRALPTVLTLTDIFPKRLFFFSFSFFLLFFFAIPPESRPPRNLLGKHTFATFLSNFRLAPPPHPIPSVFGSAPTSSRDFEVKSEPLLNPHRPSKLFTCEENSQNDDQKDGRYDARQSVQQSSFRSQATGSSSVLRTAFWTGLKATVGKRANQHPQAHGNAEKAKKKRKKASR